MAMFEPIRSTKPAEPRTDWPAPGQWTTPTLLNLPSIAEDPFLIRIVPLILGGMALAGRPGIGPVFVFMVFFIFAVLFTARKRRRQPYKVPQFIPERLRQDSEALLTMTTYVNGFAKSQDRGVLGIDGDLLFFCGAGCSFVVGVQDIDRSSSFSGYWRSSISIGSGMFLIKLQHPTVKLELKFDGTEDLEITDAFSKILALFADRAKPTTRPRSFPPIDQPRVYGQSFIQKLFAGDKPEKPQPLLSYFNR